MQEKEKKPNNRKIGETGKPSMAREFEEAMQKERDFVLNRAKQREKAEKAKTPSINIKRVTDIIKKKGVDLKSGAKSIMSRMSDTKAEPMKESYKGKGDRSNSENPMIKALINRFKN